MGNRLVLSGDVMKSVCLILLSLSGLGLLVNSVDDPAYTHPQIKEYGKVIRLPDAAQQPRDGSRLVVDIIRGGEPQQLNSAIEKVCRFVNIYAGAGRAPASADIAIVLHGDTTLCVLNDQAYRSRFGCDNPNLACLKLLRDADVEIFVCGQSLLGKGGQPDQVCPQAAVAVSALTALVNLQADGYAYIPFGK